MTQYPEVFGMHDNVDISRELADVRELFDSLLLTLGGSGEGGDEDSEKTLFNITSDILSKVSRLLFFQSSTHIIFCHR